MQHKAIESRLGNVLINETFFYQTLSFFICVSITSHNTLTDNLRRLCDFSRTIFYN